MELELHSHNLIVNLPWELKSDIEVVKLPQGLKSC